MLLAEVTYVLIVIQVEPPQLVVGARRDVGARNVAQPVALLDVVPIGHALDPVLDRSYVEQKRRARVELVNIVERLDLREEADILGRMSTLHLRIHAVLAAAEQRIAAVLEVALHTLTTQLIDAALPMRRVHAAARKVLVNRRCAWRTCRGWFVLFRQSRQPKRRQD